MPRLYRTAHAGEFDQRNHGTTILSVAGGLFAGVSKAASLTMVKIDYHFEALVIDGRPLRPALALPTNLAEIAEAFMWIVSDVKQSKAEGRSTNGDHVINVSLGKPPPSVLMF